MDDDRNGGTRRNSLGQGRRRARVVHLALAVATGLAVLATGCTGDARRNASSPDSELRFR